MRVDHHACQRATTTALTGLILQIVIAITLLVFGLAFDSTGFIFGSLFVWIGSVVWLGLIILFYQEKLQLLEQLEESELLGNDATTMFAGSGDDVRPAAARLKFIHKWVMPVLSLSVSGSLIFAAYRILVFLDHLDHSDDILQTSISQTTLTGWALAVSLGFALTTFIYSRFISGMAKIKVWANLRGGSAWMVGNAIILIAIAIGLLFKFFDNDAVLTAVCWSIPIFMLFVAAEILVNFILNLYRPRIQGESPRPAFDSKSLSVFASPDSLFKSINEAINYQFGFDITSSWGYQLLIRSFSSLIALGVIVLLLMSSFVVVESTEQGIRLRQGAIVGDVHKPGLMMKLPWPIEQSQVVDVTRLRDLPLTFKWRNQRHVILWTDDFSQHSVTRPMPFIVNDARLSSETITDDLLSLIEVRAVLRYSISEDGLLNWLQFGTDEVDRRSKYTQRELSLLAIAQRTLTEMFQELELDKVIGKERADLTSLSTARVQAALNEQQSGVHVESIDLPLIAPAASAAQSFEELSVANQGEARLISAAEGHAQSLLTRTVGDPELVEVAVEAIIAYNDARGKLERLQDSNGSTVAIEDAKTELAERELVAIATLEAGNGRASAQIRSAEVERWVTLMDTWARASRVNGQMRAYQVAPNLYMQRMYMSVLAKNLPQIRKYVIGIDPERVSLDVELRSINPLLNFADALEDDEGDN